MSGFSFSHLGDAALLRQLAEAVARDRASTADLVALIAEVDARRLYAPAGYPSMHAYAVGELRLSDEAAFKRIHAGRAARRFPQLLAALADGRLHLSAVVLIAPHLTAANAERLVAAATHRTKAEIERLLALRAPRPEPPTRLRPLGPAHAPLQASAPASAPVPFLPLALAACPVAAGIASSSVGGAISASASDGTPGTLTGMPPLGAPGAAPASGAVATPASASGGTSGTMTGTSPEPTPGAAPAPSAVATPAALESMPSAGAPVAQHAPGRVNLTCPGHQTLRVPQRFALQVTIDQQTHDLLRRAQELMSHGARPGEVGEILRRGLELLVPELERRKFAATDRPRATVKPSSRPRHVPARIKRAVWERDQGRCTFVSASGRRCVSRRQLEFDHVQPVARGGRASVDGMRLRCRAHNQYEADQVFGAGFMSEKRAGGDRRAGASGCDRAADAPIPADEARRDMSVAPRGVWMRRHVDSAARPIDAAPLPRKLGAFPLVGEPSGSRDRRDSIVSPGR